MTLAWSSDLMLALMPIAARSCWIAWAMRGLGSVLHDVELGLEAVGEAGLGQQRLGLGRRRRRSP